MISDLPHEIVDEIIDYFCADRQALVTLSGVCKAWLPRIRCHLFNYVTVLAWNCDRLLNLINSPSAVFIPFIRHLNLQDHPGRHGSNLLPRALPQLMMLTAVDELRIRDARIHLWEAGVWSSFISGFQTFALRDIRMSYGIRFESFSQLIDTLGAFPCLEHISLHVLSWVDNNTLMPSAAQKVPTRLQSLELGSVGIGHKGSILSWLLSGNAALTIAKLRIITIQRNETAAIGEFLLALGPSLKQLDLGFATSHVDSIEEAFCREVNLANNTQLSVLHFLRLSIDHVQHVSWVPVLLSQITSSSLEELVFVLAGFPAHQEPLAWGSLAHVLERPSFYGLRRVYFSLRSWQLISDGLATWISTRLPAIYARGIVSGGYDKWEGETFLSHQGRIRLQPFPGSPLRLRPPQWFTTGTTTASSSAGNSGATAGSKSSVGMLSATLPSWERLIATTGTLLIGCMVGAVIVL